MARKSYGELYAAVEEVGPELRRLVEQLTARRTILNNPIVILRIILKGPKRVVVGEFRRKDRMVHLLEPVLWRSGARLVETAEIPEINLSSAVSSLNNYLEGAELPFRAWFSCRTGNLKCKRGRLMVPKEVASFIVGLVDLRKPFHKERDGDG